MQLEGLPQSRRIGRVVQGKVSPGEIQEAFDEAG